jgi:hypothetical protein
MPHSLRKTNKTLWIVLAVLALAAIAIIIAVTMSGGGGGGYLTGGAPSVRRRRVHAVRVPHNLRAAMLGTLSPDPPR